MVIIKSSNFFRGLQGIGTSIKNKIKSPKVNLPKITNITNTQANINFIGNRQPPPRPDQPKYKIEARLVPIRRAPPPPINIAKPASPTQPDAASVLKIAMNDFKENPAAARMKWLGTNKLRGWSLESQHLNFKTQHDLANYFSLEMLAKKND